MSAAATINVPGSFNPQLADAEIIPRNASKAGRLTRLDGARGFLLTMMYLAHFVWFLQEVGIRTPLIRLHLGSYIPVWYADFFIALSGFVCALAFHGSYVNGGFGASIVAVLRRLRWIYLYQIVTAMIVVLITYNNYPMMFGHYQADVSVPLWQSLVSTWSFKTLPVGLEILIIYLVLMLFIPVASYLLANGHAVIYVGIVAACWLIAESGFDDWLGRFIDTNLFPWNRYFQLSGFLNPLSYAAMFYGAFYLGVRYKQTGTAFFTGFLKPSQTAFIVAAAVIVVATVGRTFTNIPVFHPDRENISYTQAIIVIAVTYVCCYLLASHDLPHRYRRLAAALDAFFSIKPLVQLGQDSLFVYSLQAVVVAIALVVAQATPVGESRWMVIMLFFVGYGFLFASSRLKHRYLPMLP